MKHWKRITAAVMCLGMLTSAGCVWTENPAVCLAAAAAVKDSGTYGTLIWTLEEDGTLYISGKGAMKSNESDRSWNTDTNCAMQIRSYSAGRDTLPL